MQEIYTAMEKFSLRWNDFEHNISQAFRELRDEEDFFDVTLACEDEQIQAHKVILSAGSPFFRNILKRNKHQNPLLYLKGVKYTDLQYVLSFMYQGEVDVAQEDLNTFLATAEDLGVKGLSRNKTVDQNTNEENQAGNIFPITNPASSPPDDGKRYETPSGKQLRAQQPCFPQNSANDRHEGEVSDIQDVVPVKLEEDSPDASYENNNQYVDGQEYQGGLNAQLVPTGTESYNIQDPNELLQFVRKDPTDLKHHCLLCHKFCHRSVYSTRNHVESQHFPLMFNYPCDQCEQVLHTRNALNHHRNRKHKKQENLVL